MGLVLMAAAAWVLFLAVLSPAIALGYPFLNRASTGLHPSLRANVLRAVGMAPVGLATLGVLLCFAPKLIDRALSRADHCYQHADAHAHFCLNHPPQVTVTAESFVGLALLAVALIAILAVRGWRFRRSARILNQLTATARFEGRRGAWLIDSAVPIAISVGVLRPRTLLSSGLLQMIPTRLIDAIVAHELAHGCRRDGLWKLAIELLSLGHFPGTRRALLRDLELACEQACDEEAGRALGDRTRVAEALLAMERVRQGMAGLEPAALAFGAHGVPARVESLLSDSPGITGDRRLMVGLLAVALVAAAFVADPLHHLTETLIHYVLS